MDLAHFDRNADTAYVSLTIGQIEKVQRLDRKRLLEEDLDSRFDHALHKEIARWKVNQFVVHQKS